MDRSEWDLIELIDIFFFQKIEMNRCTKNRFFPISSSIPFYSTSNGFIDVTGGIDVKQMMI